jgi:hypothetical protein
MGKKGKTKPSREIVRWKIVLKFSKKSNAKIVQNWLVKEHGIPPSMIPIEGADQDG